MKTSNDPQNLLVIGSYSTFPLEDKTDDSLWIFMNYRNLKMIPHVVPST